jgi:CHAD domain-containing protein
MNRINPKRVKEIHRFRIHAKKLRYQGEFLNSLTESPVFDLNNLKTAQSIAGRIQNDSLLLNRLDQFLSKNKHVDDAKAIAYRKQIATNQAKLISKDFKELSATKWAS